MVLRPRPCARFGDVPRPAPTLGAYSRGLHLVARLVDLGTAGGLPFLHHTGTDVPPRHRSGAMQQATTTIRRALIAAGFGALPAVSALAQISDDIRGEPSEANHFIATPDGWEHPMTPWGEPDIQAT